MPDTGDEAEIKIEYFESQELDPLSDNCQLVSASLVDSVTPKSDALSIAESRNCIEESNFIGDLSNDENNYIFTSEQEAAWYKSQDYHGRYLCKFCNLSYSTIQTVRHHVKTKHSDHYSNIKSISKNIIRQRRIKCHICKKRFNNTKVLQDHIKTHGINNIQKSCHICYATFENDNEMLYHICNERKVAKKSHFCITCGYSTSKISHFKQHLNTHSYKNKQKCSNCEYSTNYLPNLRIHERIHTQDKPYVCSFEGCDYRCVAKSALYSHQLKHNKDNNILYCDKCSYSTVYKQSLKKHLDSHIRNNVKTKY